MSTKKKYPFIYEYFTCKNIHLIKIKRIFLICSILLIISFIFLIFRKYNKQYHKEKYTQRRLNKYFKKHLEEVNEYNTYIILYFKEDCNYPEGFKNKNRKDISFIINTENNIKLRGDEALIINNKFMIEIHFNKIVTNLEGFFSALGDKNMEYLLSIDFSHFDTSFVTNMNNLFYDCKSLESINLSNLIPH